MINSLASNLGFPGLLIIDGVIRKWAPDPSKFIFSEQLPMENYPFGVVMWDSEETVRGLTPAQAVDTDPYLRSPQGREENALRTAIWAESFRLRQSDFERIRAAGRYDKMAGRDEVMKETRATDLRLESRIEWCRVNALKGSMVIDSNGVKRTLTYSLPSGHSVTAGTPWANTATADPLANILAWSLIFRGKTDGKITCYYNKQVAIWLSQSEKLLTHFTGTNMVGQLSPGNVGTLLSLLVAGEQPIEFKMYDRGYIDESGSYTPFLGNNDFLMVADPPDGQNIGSFKTTPDIRGAVGSSTEPRPGKFVTIDNRLKSKNPYYEQTQGIQGIPVIKFPECRVMATV